MVVTAIVLSWVDCKVVWSEEIEDFAAFARSSLWSHKFFRVICLKVLQHIPFCSEGEFV